MRPGNDKDEPTKENEIQKDKPEIVHSQIRETVRFLFDVIV